MALSSLLATGRPISARRGARKNIPFLTDSGMMRFVPILFVATQISRSLAWSWASHQTPPDPTLPVAEDIIQNNFDGNFDLIIARFVHSATRQSRTLTDGDRCPLYEQRYSETFVPINYLTTAEDALQSYKRKPDCFQDAIAMVKAHCEESRMDEQERIQGTLIRHFSALFAPSNHAYKLPLA